MSRINQKEAIKHERIACLDGVQKGISISTEIWKNGVTLPLDQILKPYKDRVDSLNDQTERNM